MTAELPIFWSSATHQGVIKHLQGTSADGVVHDLGVWADAKERKSGRTEGQKHRWANPTARSIIRARITSVGVRCRSDPRSRLPQTCANGA